MADKEIVNLPAIPAFRDDAQLVVYVPGSSEPAQKMTGAQLREYAERAAANVKKGDKGEKGDPGDVSSVNGVRPNAAGNVALTAADVGAMPAYKGNAKDLGFTSLASVTEYGTYHIVDGPSFLADYPAELTAMGLWYATLIVFPNGGYQTKMLIATNGGSANCAIATSVAGSSWKVSCTTDYALPRDGSAAMTGKLVTATSEKGRSLLGNGDGSAFFETYTKDNYATRRSLIIYNTDSEKGKSDDSNAVVMYNAATNKTNTILHTGNKPSGSYTGNGSAARREIPLGGTTNQLKGNVVAVWSAEYGYGIVFAVGAIMANINGSKYFSGGAVTSGPTYGLVLNTNDNFFNANGVTYYYQGL